ncbi:MAG: sulfite exporter TauE/SafE family protein [Desulfuromonadaceae bacterium]|nr:sulfite exporter TauE/SafE family protein [Desulfuromonadaceae bacterium]
MEIVVVSIAALFASALTLFSGFGLGTLLMPVVAIFFPVEIAIAITAMVHLANNLFKVALLGKKANRSVLLSFGVPAVISAFFGALVLGWLSVVPSILEYSALGNHIQVSPLKLVVGMLILAFIALELSPKFSSMALDKKYLPYGGVVSGFFGGLSGHQGALRSMFLLKAGLDKEEFVATGVMLAVMVDVSRMLIYGWEMAGQHHGVEWPLVIAASVSAFVGAYFGSKILKKITISFVQVVVSVLLVVVSLGLMSGVM